MGYKSHVLGISKEIRTKLNKILERLLEMLTSIQTKTATQKYLNSCFRIL
jgi:hypothetical protein